MTQIKNIVLSKVYVKKL